MVGVKKSNAKKRAPSMEVGVRNGKGKLGKYLVQGGPYSGKVLLLATAGTMTFKLGNWFGHYNEKCIWESA